MKTPSSSPLLTHYRGRSYFGQVFNLQDWRSKHLKGLSFWLSLGSEMWNFTRCEWWWNITRLDFMIMMFCYSRSCCSKANEELVQGGEGQRKTPTLKHLKLHNWCKSHASKIHFCKHQFFCVNFSFHLWIFALKLIPRSI